MNKTIVSLILFFITAFIMIIGIFTSRSSTAAIGIFFIPFFGAIPIIIFHVFSIFKNKYMKWVGFIFIAIFWGYFFNGILKTRAHNHQKDTEAELAQKRYVSALTEFNQGIKNYTGNEEKYIKDLFEKNPNREWKLILLSSKFCPKNILNEYAKSPDMGFSYSVSGNSNAPEEALNYIYFHQTYQFYYYSSLARNPSTPAAILRDLYLNRVKNTIIEPGLRTNPNTPEDIKKLLQ